MILGLLGAGWFDHWLQGRPGPGWLNGGVWPAGTVLLIVALIVSILASRELAAIFKSKGLLASNRVMTFAAMSGLVVSCLVPMSVGVTNAIAIVGTAALLVLFTSVVFHARHKSTEGIAAAAGGAMFSFVYLGLMFGFLLAIRKEHSVVLLLWVLLVTKACDIGAYFTGKAIGRHKMIPWLSPGKTWEGLGGGLGFSSLVAVGGMWFIDSSLVRLAWWWPVVAGVVFGGVGQIGDLIESTLKRDAGKKDSGASIPGFGGVLDVLDSPLFVAPLAYWWIAMVTQMGYLVGR